MARASFIPFVDDPIDYKIGDKVVAKGLPNNILGICTGFVHNDTCVEIDGVCYGGKYHFQRSEFLEEHEYVII